MNEIWLGPLLGNNRSRLIERCLKLVATNQSDSFIYLAASQPLLELVTQGVLDGTTNRGVWGELPVYLFRGFIRRILSTASSLDGQTQTPRIRIDSDDLPLKRSLISQILSQLVAAQKLEAFAPLAARDGCVNSVTNLMGEIQRAAKTPEEVAQIIAARTNDLPSDSGRSQIDYDREVSLIYSTYSSLLESNQLTDDDADQLRALQILRSEVVPEWLKNVDLLILDGFFDFTPVQGEILRQLIPRLSTTIVNLNYDERNPEIFLPFQETVAQLSSMSDFEVMYSADAEPTSGPLASLREKLFNTTAASAQPADDNNNSDDDQTSIRYLECGDRDTEIRSIAREIKRLRVKEGLKLSEIALIVRQRASYGPTISRVMREEGVPCRLSPRVDSPDVPSIRAVVKLLSLLETPAEENIRISDIADLVKSEYFRLSDEDLQELALTFDEQFSQLLNDGEPVLNDEAAARLKLRYRVGFWDADSLENTFAYVGSDLPVNAWIGRATQLIKELPAAEATKELLSIDSGAADRETDVADQVENAEIVKLEDKGVAKKRRPSRDVHPSTIGWTILVIQRFSEIVKAIPRESTTTELRPYLMRLFERLEFREQIVKPTKRSIDERELPQVMLNFNALESMRRALVAATKSIEIVQKEIGVETNQKTRLSTFIGEVKRSLAEQSQELGAADRGGLRVLEATDVRGLRFRAIFIAGLIEGGFPMRTSRDWIYPHEERDRLKQYGLTLEDISPATLLKEEHYFYQTACRATERLYLSRPLMLEDDSETVASYYIDELRRAIAPLKLETEIVRRDYDGRKLADASSAEELSVSLVRQQERHEHSGDKTNLLSQPRLKRLLSVARNDGFVTDAALRRIEIERERAGDIFGSYDGQVTNPSLLTMLAERFGPESIHSASGLSVYGNCGFRFFAQRVLRLEPRGEAALDLQAIDAGKLLHDILRRFFEGYRRTALYQLDRDALRKELAEIADKVFDEHERVVPPLNRQIWKIDREIRKILLDQVLLYEISLQEEAVANGVLPAFFEVAFGNPRFSTKDPASTSEPLELTRNTFVGSESIKINGQIDRVDVASDNTFIAYDYKLSTGQSKEDIRSGRSLQIPIYLEALERLILPGYVNAGGGYYIIRGAGDRRNRGIHRKSKNEYLQINSRVSALLSDEEWDEVRREAIAKIWEFLDGMRSGRFLVNPAERNKTCRFCDFTAVCRYDRYRIDKKKN
ncbi:MAG TPA: PD-(D/E)XK nuclease family protein [Pyrinomonadaceae bacterium]|nr:PD-(D/E)XK nuclease family protein [Pyrinomonadaceae bacterium]